MKRTIYVFAILLAVFTSCGDEKNEDGVYMSNVAKSGCKQKVEKVNGLFQDEFVEYEAFGDGSLHIKHSNASFSCEHKDIEVSLSVSENVISIYETEIDGVANCLCDYDLDYTLKGLETEKEYVLTLYQNGNLRGRYPFTYTKTLKGKELIKSIAH